jgi:leucyl aminopeptidase
MEIDVIQGNITQATSDVLILNYFEDSGALSGEIAAIDGILGGIITQLKNNREIKGKFKDITVIYTLGKLPAPKIAIVGLGKKAELNADRIRMVIAEVCRALRQKSPESIDSVACGSEIPGISLETIGQSIAEGVLLGTYTFLKYKTKAPEYKEIQQFNIIESDGTKIEPLKKGCQKGQIISRATNQARDWVNEPANVINPAALASIAGELAQKYGLEIQVLERNEMRSLGMGGLLGVSQGSEQPPKFIVLTYRGKNSGNLDVALVGKGITFDSGGISLKPSENMGEMKGDMAGAAAVIAAISAIAQLKPQINVVALVPATENLPSGTAMRPGDIIKIMNGKTVEIISTDAEGRLILADALGYALKLGARKLVDVATLTGACRVALGDICIGAFSNNREWVKQVIAAGDEAGENLWQMPMFEDYRDLNKSDIADMKNTGGRYAGAISAAWFLREYVESTPWVHLDIAGPFMTERDKGYQVKGATGVAVRTLINLVLRTAD